MKLSSIPLFSMHGGGGVKNDPVYWLIFLYIMMIMNTKATSRKVHIVRGQLRNNTLAVGTDNTLLTITNIAL